jgi:hypothetical protein
MLKASSLVRGVVATFSFLIAGSALAEGGTWQPEVGWGRIQGSHVSGPEVSGTNNAPTLDFALGYRWENGFGVRAMSFGALDIFKDLFNQPSPRSFDEFNGVQATGYFPLASKLNLMTGLGLGRTSLNRGVPGDHQELTEGIASAGLQYNIVKYFSLELHLDYLTRTHERNLILMAEFPF